MREKSIYPFFNFPKENIPVKKKIDSEIFRMYGFTPPRSTKEECYEDMIECIEKVIKVQ